MANFDFSHVPAEIGENTSPDLKPMELCQEIDNEVGNLFAYLLDLSDEDFMSERTQIELEYLRKIEIKLARLYMKL